MSRAAASWPRPFPQARQTWPGHSAPPATGVPPGGARAVASMLEGLAQSPEGKKLLQKFVGQER